jgi:hypothetical protein
VAYKANGRSYHIRDTIIHPPAHDLVKPLVEGPGNVVEWWRDPGQGREEENSKRGGATAELEGGSDLKSSRDNLGDTKKKQ